MGSSDWEAIVWQSLRVVTRQRKGGSIPFRKRGEDLSNDGLDKVGLDVFPDPIFCPADPGHLLGLHVKDLKDEGAFVKGGDVDATPHRAIGVSRPPITIRAGTGDHTVIISVIGDDGFGNDRGLRDDGKVGGLWSDFPVAFSVEAGAKGILYDRPVFDSSTGVAPFDKAGWGKDGVGFIGGEVDLRVALTGNFRAGGTTGE